MVMPQTGWPTSASSKGTPTLSVASAGDLCSGWAVRTALQGCLSLEAKRKGKEDTDGGTGTYVLTWKRRCRYPRQFSGREAHALTSPTVQAGHVGPPYRVAPRALCSPQLPCKVLPHDAKSPGLSGEPTLRLLCVLMTTRQCPQRTLPSAPRDKKQPSRGCCARGK